MKPKINLLIAVMKKLKSDSRKHCKLIDTDEEYGVSVKQRRVWPNLLFSYQLPNRLVLK